LDTASPSGDSPSCTEGSSGDSPGPGRPGLVHSFPWFLLIDPASLLIGASLLIVLFLVLVVVLREALGWQITFQGARRKVFAAGIGSDSRLSGGQDAGHRREMMANLGKLGDLQVRQIMQARVSVVAVNRTATFAQLMETVRESGYSRIPVYEHDLDTITGILHVKDLISLYTEGKDEPAWQQCVRTPVLYVPEAKRIDKVLAAFQTRRQHLAVVVDEYGGTAGLITMEDILEEIFGEIQDEFDGEPDVPYQKNEDGSYLFEGRTLIQDFCQIMQVESTHFEELDTEADSIAGLILDRYGELPPQGFVEEIKGFHFEITAVSSRRIEQIRVSRIIAF